MMPEMPLLINGSPFKSIKWVDNVSPKYDTRIIKIWWGWDTLDAGSFFKCKNSWKLQHSVVWLGADVVTSRLALPVEIHYLHYTDVIMGAIASRITSITIFYSTVYSDADQRKHQSSASLALVNSPHKWPVTQKVFLFDDVIMRTEII